MGAIYDSVTQQAADLVCKGLKPRSVSFSSAGFTKVLQERDSMDVRAAMQGPTYAGLPHYVAPEQAEDVVVSDQTIEQRTTRQRVPAVSFRVDGLDPRKSTMHIVGQSLTAAQLCDVIRAFLDADDATHWGDFEKALDEAVTTHGRFE